MVVEVVVSHNRPRKGKKVPHNPKIRYSRCRCACIKVADWAVHILALKPRLQTLTACNPFPTFKPSMQQRSSQVVVLVVSHNRPWKGRQKEHSMCRYGCDLKVSKSWIGRHTRALDQCAICRQLLTATCQLTVCNPIPSTQE